jgi:hypothetical protein
VNLSDYGTLFFFSKHIMALQNLENVLQGLPSSLGAKNSPFIICAKKITFNFFFYKFLTQVCKQERHKHKIEKWQMWLVYSLPYPSLLFIIDIQLFSSEIHACAHHSFIHSFI